MDQREVYYNASVIEASAITVIRASSMSITRFGSDVPCSYLKKYHISFREKVPQRFPLTYSLDFSCSELLANNDAKQKKLLQPSLKTLIVDNDNGASICFNRIWQTGTRSTCVERNIHVWNIIRVYVYVQECGIDRQGYATTCRPWSTSRPAQMWSDKSYWLASASM